MCQIYKISIDIISFDNNSYHLRYVQLLSSFTDGNLSLRMYAKKAHAQGTKEMGPFKVKGGKWGHTFHPAIPKGSKKQ